MKKIGVVTIFNVLNYGAVLQALALYTKIEDLGYKAFMINYVPKQLMHKTRRPFYELNLSFLQNLKNLIKYYFLRIGYNKDLKFKRFIQENEDVTDSVSIIDGSELPEYHAIVVGSDQVWNAEYVGNKIDDNYLLKYVPNKIRKISFSSSMGSYIPDANAKVALKENLKNFYSLGVREKYAMEILSDIGLRNITVTCDPTFLLKKEQWDVILEKVCPEVILDFDYLLIYTFDNDKRCFDIARLIAKKKNLKIISIGSMPKVPRCVYKQYSSLSPSGFLSLFKQSSFVVTNSFHGTCFSIIYEKDFLSINKTNNPIRIKELLDSLHLEDRLCKTVNDLNHIDLSINYSAVSKYVELLRTNSIDYLKKSLC